VPENLLGKRLTVKASFDLGPLNAKGTPLASEPVSVEL
jgi:hypothetical protein